MKRVLQVATRVVLCPLIVVSLAACFLFGGFLIGGRLAFALWEWIGDE